MNNPRVAIMVSTYNGERVIGKCVQSLINTDYENKEVIVVNDGSSDNTPKILDQFGDRLTVLQGSRNGVASSRNRALAYTEAELIATTDDDCEAQPDWIKNALPYFEDKEVAAVTGEKIYRVTNLISAVRSKEYWVRYRNRGREANSVECPVTIFRISALRAVGGFSVWTLVGGEDTDIGYKLKEAGYKIIFEPEMIVYHDPEESFFLYLSRNFRNAVAYVRVFSSRSKKESLSDDFFPWYILYQPFFTFFFYAALISSFFYPRFFLGAIILLILVNLTFFNVTREVFKIYRRTLKTFLASQSLLFIRNTVWLGGLIVGLKNLTLNWLRRRKS